MVQELMTASGLLLRRDAVAGGYDDNYLARLVAAGVIVRVRQGAYVAAERWHDAGERGRHLLASEAVSLQYDAIALSHDTAVLEHGGPDYGLDLTTVDVTHFRGGGRRVAGVTHHEGALLAGDVTRRDGRWLTTPARTVLDVAIRHGVETGVVVADDFLRRELTSSEELRLVYERMQRWPGAIGGRLVIDLASGESESVGESLGWLLFRRLRLPAPVRQFEVRRPDGRLVGRTDWAWPQFGVLCEFDGRDKYMRLRRPGESVVDTVLREKRREDRLREVTGWRFIRLTWADLFREVETERRLRAVLSRAA